MRRYVINTVLVLLVSGAFCMDAATQSKRPIYVDVQSDDASLAARIHDRLVLQIAASSNAIIATNESSAFYAVRIAVTSVRSRRGTSLGWVAAYAVTGSAVCGSAKVSLVTFLGTGVLQGNRETASVDDEMRSLVVTLDERLTGNH